MIKDKSIKVVPADGIPYWIMVSSKTGNTIFAADVNRNITPMYLTHRSKGRINEAIVHVNEQEVEKIIKTKPLMDELLNTYTRTGLTPDEEHLEPILDIIKDEYFYGKYTTKPPKYI